MVFVSDGSSGNHIVAAWTMQPSTYPATRPISTFGKTGIVSTFRLVHPQNLTGPQAATKIETADRRVSVAMQNQHKQKDETRL